MSLFETKEQMVRTLNEWDSKTFGEIFKAKTSPPANIDCELMWLVERALAYQDLMEKRMNGYCSEGLHKFEYEKMKICYVDLVNKLDDSGEFWTPLDIVVEMCKHNMKNREFCEKKAKLLKMDFETLTFLMCGRALRALPSYIREYQLRNALSDTFPKGKFVRDETMDKKYHCDIKMILNDNTYYVWSFINSTKSIAQFVDKFSDNRYGHVPEGHHILCPFDRKRECGASYKGWAFYSKRYLEEVRIAMFQRTHIDYHTLDTAQLVKPTFYRRPVVVHKSSVPTQAAS
jgi:hypothetical protein